MIIPRLFLLAPASGNQGNNMQHCEDPHNTATIRGISDLHWEARDLARGTKDLAGPLQTRRLCSGVEGPATQTTIPQKQCDGEQKQLKEEVSFNEIPQLIPVVKPKVSVETTDQGSGMDMPGGQYLLDFEPCFCVSES